MRFLSKTVSGVQVFAVCGNHTVSFGISASSSARTGLMGFAIDRTDLDAPVGSKNRSMPMLNAKLFKSEMGKKMSIADKSMWKHPLQSFVWDDFNVLPDRHYEYVFTPLQGKPGKLTAIPGRGPVSIKLRTEREFSTDTHDVFFNRGVASSQAYAAKFENKKPDDLKPAQRLEAYAWLSRGLDTAILKFIKQAAQGDTLLCCFYEFSYQPVADALETARTNGVHVRIILDGKQNGTKNKKTGKVTPPFPRQENEQTKKAAHLPDSVVKWREANPSNIEHNKFMVLLKGKNATPAEVWTGSTNISQGGIFGQTNVGHWIRDPKTAALYVKYWDLLYKDPGSKKGDDRTTAATAKKDYRTQVEAITKAPTKLSDINKGVTSVFSPRSGVSILKNYADLIDQSQKSAAITLAFGIGKEFKDVLKDNKPTGPLIFMLLEKKDVPAKPRKSKLGAAAAKPKAAFVRLNSKNNIYEAWGSYLKDPLYQWTRETNTRAMKLNEHVAYLHTKFLLHDPLGDDPIVVTGSANFSDASTQDNDENMVIIRGDTRVADIYFTEFNRLFFHYYFRSVTEDRKGVKDAQTVDSLFLDERGTEWQKKYAPGTLKTKRVSVYAEMKGAGQG